MKFNIFLISLVFISIGSILLCYHAFDAEPNEPNVLVWDDNDPNDRKIKYDIDDGMYEVVVAEPNEPEYDTIYTDESGNDIVICDANDAVWDANDTVADCLTIEDANSLTWDVNGNAVGSYTIVMDPKLCIDSTFISDGVLFYLNNNEEWAEFNRKDEGVVSCNISEAEFLKYFPKFLYSFMGKVDPNVQYVIEWAEPNEVKQ